MDTVTSNLDSDRRLPVLGMVIRNFGADDQGVTAIEYALLAALIAMICLGSISATGSSVDQVYTRWTQAVVSAL